jgi:hypothetical protein
MRRRRARCEMQERGKMGWLWALAVEHVVRLEGWAHGLVGQLLLSAGAAVSFLTTSGAMQTRDDEVGGSGRQDQTHCKARCWTLLLRDGVHASVPARRPGSGCNYSRHMHRDGSAWWAALSQRLSPISVSYLEAHPLPRSSEPIMQPAPPESCRLQARFHLLSIYA